MKPNTGFALVSVYYHQSCALTEATLDPSVLEGVPLYLPRFSSTKSSFVCFKILARAHAAILKEITSLLTKTNLCDPKLAQHSKSLPPQKVEEHALQPLQL